MQTQTRTFCAPDDLWDAVVTPAEQTGVNTSEILRRATANYEPVRLAADSQSVREVPARPQDARYNAGMAGVRALGVTLTLTDDYRVMSFGDDGWGTMAASTESLQ